MLRVFSFIKEHLIDSPHESVDDFRLSISAVKWSLSIVLQSEIVPRAVGEKKIACLESKHVLNMILAYFQSDENWI